LFEEGLPLGDDGPSLRDILFNDFKGFMERFNGLPVDSLELKDKNEGDGGTSSCSNGPMSTHFCSLGLVDIVVESADRK
jgi:hypothetical protein